MRRTHELVESQVQRETVLRDGVVHSVRESSQTQYPKSDDSAPRDDDTRDSADEVNASFAQEFVLSSSSESNVQLISIQDSQAAADNVLFDDLIESQRHVMHQEELDAGSKLEFHELRSKVVELLEAFEAPQYDSVTGNLANDPSGELLHVLRQQASAHDVVALLSDDALHESVGDETRAVLFNLLASLDTPAAQMALLDFCRDDTLPWQLRNRALMSLALFRAPTRQVVESVGRLYRLAETELHVRRQAVLTFGALVYNYEAASDAAVRHAELARDNALGFGDEPAERAADEALRVALDVQSRAAAQAEAWRLVLHTEFERAPAASAVADAPHVEQFAKALHNSLKDIAPHAWMDAAAILRVRGVSLAEFVAAERAGDAALTAAAARMDAAAAPLSGVREVRRRQVQPADEARIVDKNDALVQNLATKPPNFDAWMTPASRENVAVSKTIRNFFEEHKCSSRAACSPYSYRQRRPASAPEQGNRQLWNNTIGSDKFYAYLEALLDFRASPYSGAENVGSEYQFFAGGLVSANVFEAELPILQAYAAGGFKHRARYNELGANCTSFELELYFDYLANAYYLKASEERNCTRGVPSTCQARYPEPSAITHHQFAGVEFFRFDFRVNEAWLNALFTVRGLGSVGLNVNWGFAISEEKGGLALNGLVEPIGKVDIVTTVTSPVIKYDGFDVLQLGIEGTLNLLQLSFPAYGALNAQTYKGCSRLAVATRALGGTIELKMKVFYVGDAAVEIFRWKGAQFELPVLETQCCVDCAEACYNAVCNYRFGECECLLGYDGPGCDIECPAECEWPDDDDDAHDRVDCVEGGPRGAACACNAGSFGWNCLSACPGGRETPCSGHGECDLEGQCHCAADYYGDDCSITCPRVDELPCGVHGRCVFDGVDARCQCFANAVGPECEQQCPQSLDERAAPCSRRGDCWRDPRTDAPACLCRLGFHGERCELIDANGSGRSLAINSPLPAGIQFQRAQHGAAERFDALRGGAAAHAFAGVWIKPTQWPSGRPAALLEWKFGRLELTADGQVRWCGASDQCVASPAKATLGQWQYVAGALEPSGAAVRLYRLGEPSGNDNAARGAAHAPLDMQDDVVRVARRYVGELDQLALLYREQLPFSAADIELVRDEIVADHHEALQFYVLFDLGRGDHVYDQVGMLRGELPDRCGELSAQAPVECRDERFVSSGVRVKRATINSPDAPPMQMGGAAQRRRAVYPLAIDGRRLIGASMEVVLDSCSTLEVFVGGVSAATLASGSGGGGRVAATLDFNEQALSALRDGDNAVEWIGNSECVLAESFLSAQVAAADAAIEFGGSPYSFGVLPHASVPLSGAWTIELWARRDTSVASHNGLLLALVEADYQPTEALSLAARNADFLLYESGGSGFGLRYRYAGGGTHVFENYATPVDRWFHLAFGVVTSGGGQCRLAFYVDGVDAAANNPSARAPCSGAGALAGFGGGPAMQLRIGAGFGGELNDLLIWNRAPPSDTRARMHRLKDVAASRAQLLAAYTFDAVRDNNPTALIDESLRAGEPSDGRLTNGAFRSLIYGVAHRWRMCPGVTQFSSETVCSTRTLWEQGYCVARDGVDNFACECNDGFFGPECAGVCPGGAGNICSGHGQCQMLDDTVCVCDAGYVGDACQHECPGWSAPQNLPNQKLCWGFGRCQMREDNQAAECVCDQKFDRYGAFCQYSYGEDPVASIEDQCDADCRGPHKVCVDGSCLCAQGYYLVVGVCKAPASQLAINALLALFAVACVASSKILHF